MSMKRTLAALLALLAVHCHAEPWRYDRSNDVMTGKASVEAVMISNNNLDLEFPYKSANNFGFLAVRQHPTHGLDVIVGIDKGQMLCHRNDCQVSVKFDDAQPIVFAGNPPSDHSSTAIFIRDSGRFIAQAKKAKRVLVQFTAFRNGTPVLDFYSPDSLVWPPR